MPNNWKTYNLDEVCIRITDGSHSSPKELSTGKYQIATVKDMSGYGFSLDQCKKISDKDFEYLKSQDCVPEKGDVLFSKDGTIGKVLHFDFNYKIGVLSSIAIFRPNDKIINSKFLSYYLSERNNNNFIIDNYRSGSAIPRIILRDFKKYELTIPQNLQEQKSIASILSTIDDKIENNLAINKTLEEMAMALYKHWFVDFGPFQDGNFVESELGMIPEGWEVKNFFELFELLSGGTPKTSVNEYWNGNVNWVSAKDIGSNNTGLYINETEKKITELGVKKSAAKILPEDTVIVVARGSVGKYGMITRPMAMNQSCYGIYSKSTYSQPLTYLLVQSLMNHFMQVSYGSVFDTITTSTFKGINVLLPSENVLKEIKESIDGYFSQIKENIKENQTLTQLRDTLLPKLISGEVRLKEFREQVEKVV